MAMVQRADIASVSTIHTTQTLSARRAVVTGSPTRSSRATQDAVVAVSEILFSMDETFLRRREEKR